MNLNQMLAEKRSIFIQNKKMTKFILFVFLCASIIACPFEKGEDLTLVCDQCVSTDREKLLRIFGLTLADFCLEVLDFGCCQKVGF